VTPPSIDLLAFTELETKLTTNAQVVCEKQQRPSVLSVCSSATYAISDHRIKIYHNIIIIFYHCNMTTVIRHLHIILYTLYRMRLHIYAITSETQTR